MLIRQVGRAEGIVREARDRESNARDDATREINDEMTGQNDCIYLLDSLPTYCLTITKNVCAL